MLGTVTPPSVGCESSVFVNLNGEVEEVTSATVGSLQHRLPHAWCHGLPGVELVCSLCSTAHLLCSFEKQRKGLDTLNQTRSEK